MDEDALAHIAADLYAAPFDEFVTARAAAGKQAGSTDKALGAAVRKLPKPSVAAWVLNLLAVHGQDTLAGLSDLGDRMQAAQKDLDSAALRELGRERRTLLAAAVVTARDLAAQHGRPVSGTIATDVEESLRALTADPGAAAAIRSGLLLKAVSADGVNPVDLTDAVAIAGAGPASPTEPGTTSAPPDATASPKPRLEAVRETPRPASPSALEKAEAALAVAQDDEARAGESASELQSRAEQATASLAALEVDVVRLRADLKAAEERLVNDRKSLAGTVAAANQSQRVAAKAARAAVLAQERVLRLGNTRD